MGRRAMEWDQVEHGTMTGYRWHVRRKVPVCEDCRDAKRDYSRDDARVKRKAERDAAPRKAAWQRACARLAAKYPAEFREILTEEMRGLVDLPPEDDEQGESNGD